MKADGIYTTATEARFLWFAHLMDLPRYSGIPRERLLSAANDKARRSGRLAGRCQPDLTCPHMLADVGQLAQEWSSGRTGELERLAALRTGAGIKKWLEALYDEANRGCGLVYELMVDRFSTAVDSGIDEIEKEFQEEAFQLARSMGYTSPEERLQTHKENQDDGYCPLTGIDPDCCPCGRHE
ncbi:hypothetical protein [Herbaspirillum huttiense]|uniref:hypothetical protein n=1 Tax=Herbaspirillum huttiense TaxID=863372 RepID=UPI0039B0672E